MSAVNSYDGSPGFDANRAQASSTPTSAWGLGGATAQNVDFSRLYQWDFGGILAQLNQDWQVTSETDGSRWVLPRGGIVQIRGGASLMGWRNRYLYQGQVYFGPMPVQNNQWSVLFRPAGG